MIEGTIPSTIETDSMLVKMLEMTNILEVDHGVIRVVHQEIVMVVDQEEQEMIEKIMVKMEDILFLVMTETLMLIMIAVQEAEVEEDLRIDILQEQVIVLVIAEQDLTDRNTEEMKEVLLMITKEIPVTVEAQEGLLLTGILQVQTIVMEVEKLVEIGMEIKITEVINMVVVETDMMVTDLEVTIDMEATGMEAIDTMRQMMIETITIEIEILVARVDPVETQQRKKILKNPTTLKKMIHFHKQVNSLK
jgi:hypothetical protein